MVNGFLTDEELKADDRGFFETAADEYLGLLDTTAPFVTGLAGSIPAGLAGLGVGAANQLGFDTGRTAGGTVDDIRDVLTWEPKTVEGQRNLGALGEGADAVLDWEGVAPGGVSLREAGQFYNDEAVPWLQENMSPEIGAALGAGGIVAAETLGPGKGVRAPTRQLGLDDINLGGRTADRPLALPNPARKRQANAVRREEKWQALEKAERNAGKKRNKKTGQYVGAAPGIKSPQKRTAIVNKYDERTQRALDAGIDPDYFYGSGRETLARLTDNPAEHDLISQLYGPTSTQVGPRSNTDYVVRALDQKAMGVPPSVTLYPNSQRPQIDAIAAGEDPWKGEKVDRYSYLLGPRDPNVNRMQNMPPNDQWEGYGTGRERGSVPSGAPQVAWSDDIRARAIDRTNKRRVAEGEPPLTLEQSQALHWAAIRAEAEGRPLQINPNDTLQGSLPQFEVQHAWEAEPGAASGIQRTELTKDEYADEVLGVLQDGQGKDKLVRAMGGRLQEPIVRGTGVWEGELNPGMQSRSFGSHTQSRGLEPTSEARIDATEAVRQYMLGQEGRAYSLNQPTQQRQDISVADFNTGRTPTREEAGMLQESVGERGIVVPRAEGYRVVDTDPDRGILVDSAGVADTGPTFADEMDRLNLSKGPVQPGAMSPGKNLGKYSGMDWAGGNATRDLLATLDESRYPGPGRLADSAETRHLAGEISDLYQRLDAAGKLSQNHKLTQVLEAWRSGGLDAVRTLVDKGLAPAVVLGVLGAAQSSDRSEPSPSI